MSPGAQGTPLRPDQFLSILEVEAPKYGLALDGESLDSLSRYLSELDRWRRKTNLTGPIGAEGLSAHVLESCFGEKLIDDDKRVLDIGSGAGLPGLPIAICRLDLSVTLLESRGKKAAFLRHVVRTLPVGNASVLEQRLEGLSTPFDAATIRAVGRLPELIEGAPFLEPGGLLLAWTTDSQRLKESFGASVSFSEDLPIPGSRRRSIAAFRKPGVPRGNIASSD